MRATQNETDVPARLQALAPFPGEKARSEVNSGGGAPGEPSQRLRVESAGLASPERPKLLVFGSESSGRCRRAEGFLAQVLQRRRNHDTFAIYSIDLARRPDLFERFRVDTVPTFVIAERRRTVARLVGTRGCAELEDFLRPWLR